jgi:hypothetical protein
MSWLSKIFNYVPPKERKGISLEENSWWEVSCAKDSSSFFLALIDLVPYGSILFFEGTSISKDIQLFLEARKPKRITKVALGTIWPRPKCFHMTIIRENLEGISQLVDKHVGPEIADNLHIYKDKKIILQWYDAFFASDPFYISKEIPEEKVKDFCSKLNISYKIGKGK